MAHFLTWEPTGVYAKFVGPCTVNDVHQAYRKISKNPCLDDLHYVIFDCLDMAQHNMSESEIEKVAAFDMGLAYFYPAPKFATVTTDQRILELWRHFVSVAKIPGRHAVFPTVSAARDWLQTGDRC
jgi:hypothetical protein